MSKWIHYRTQQYTAVMVWMIMSSPKITWELIFNARVLKVLVFGKWLSHEYSAILIGLVPLWNDSNLKGHSLPLLSLLPCEDTAFLPFERWAITYHLGSREQISFWPQWHKTRN
jgi:hypothetical protein